MIVVGVLTLAALLTAIAVAVLLSIASRLEIVPPLFARGRERIDKPPRGSAAAARGQGGRTLT
jgi:hypothetical protein